MTFATKKEALAAVNAARTKAQNAAVAWQSAVTAIAQSPRQNHDLMVPGLQVNRDAAWSHYERCITELEQAINDAAPFETSGDDE